MNSNQKIIDRWNTKESPRALIEFDEPSEDEFDDEADGNADLEEV